MKALQTRTCEKETSCGMDALSPKEFAIVNELASLLRKNGRTSFHGNCSILIFFLLL